MNLHSTDYLLTRFAHSLQGQMKLLGDVETDWLGDRLEAIEIDRPVFITGLARSGTTILLNLLAQLPQVATHRYRDFPFLFVPIAWNRLQGRLGKTDQPVERPHRDRIKITRDSPEAFEEPIWAHFFPSIHDPGALHRLTAADRQPEFDEFFLQHLRKLLLLRGGTRYVSKGNYNVTRIEYLADLLPDARFVIPVRHPVAQVESLMRQHRLFGDYAARDERVPQYLKAAGHFEFGPQRVPVNIDREHARLIAEAWSAGHDDLGYALMWRSIYSHVATLRRVDEHIGKRVAFVRYEDLCHDPAHELRSLARFCELEDGIDALLARLPDVSPRKSGATRLSERQRARVWDATQETAKSFGYAPG
jgi:Sulfotransferase family